VTVGQSGAEIEAIYKNCEVYCVENNSWTFVGSMSNPRSEHIMFKLNDQIILIMGGAYSMGYYPIIELYDISSFQSIYDFNFPAHMEPGKNSIQLGSGNIFVAGGNEFSISGDIPFKRPSSRTFIYDNMTNIISTEITKPKFNLVQNYPNPFNNSTVIKYSITESSEADLSIFDILGNHVLTLFKEFKSKGDYQHVLNSELSNQLSSGIYICTLKVSNKTKSIKIILIK
jgi:hypothetical protein